MFPYWILFTIFSAGALEHRRKGVLGQGYTPLLIASGLFVSLLVGLRYDVGGDWETYENLFQLISYLSLDDAIDVSDPGFAFLNWLSHQLGFGIWFVNLFCGVVFTWGLVKFAVRQPNPWLAVLVAVPYLIIVVAMGYTRQGVSIGFILAALSVAGKTSLLRLSLYILLAALFHKTAIIVLPLVALAATRNRIATFGLLGITGGLLYYLLLSESVENLITNYVEAGYSSQGAAIRVTMNLVPALLFLLFQRRFALSEDERKLWRNFSIGAVMALLMLVTTASSTAVDRLSLYLIPLQMFVLARLPESFPNKGRPNGQLLLAVIGYSALIQFVWLNYAEHAQYWIPYRLNLTEIS